MHDLHKLQAHQNLTHRPARFHAARRPTNVVGHTVAFPMLEIERARPRAVKQRIVTVDLTGEQEEGKPLEVLWTSYIGGPASSSLQQDVQRLTSAVDQAFAQSPYLKGPQATK